MQLICSQGHPVKWNDKECPECGENQSLFAYVKRKAKRVGSGPLVYCTSDECGKAYPVGYEECPFCERENSVENAFSPFADKLRVDLEKVKPRTRRIFQRGYLLVSGGVLVVIIRQMTSLNAWDWVRVGTLSIIYLGSIALLIKLFVRTDIIIKFLLLTSWVVKLALVFNYLASLLLLQKAATRWWAQFVVLGAIVVITYGGVWAFCWLFWPAAETFKNIFFGQNQANIFDSMKDQGRRGRYDDGRGGGGEGGEGGRR